MPALSSAAWVVHDVGLATAIGGSLYGRYALEPALRELPNPDDRDRISDRAWRRFSWLDLAAHGAVALTWFAGRSMLSGREAGPVARRLTVAKDACIAASIVTGVAAAFLGRMLGKRTRQHHGPQAVRAGEADDRKTLAIQRAVDAVGTANLAANVAALGITAVLAMQAGESLRFKAISRHLP